MSVINQMLKDLDARGGGDAQRRAALAAAGQGASPKAGAPKSGRVAVIVAVLLTATAAALIVWWLLPRQPALPEPSKPAPASEAATPVVALAPPNERPPTPTVAAPAPQPDAQPDVQRDVQHDVRRDVPPDVQRDDRPDTPRAEVVAEPPPPAPPARSRIEVLPAADVDPLAAVREALAEGNADEALRLLGVIRSREPAPVAEAEALAAAALQQQGRHEAAIGAYTRALRGEPDIGAWWAGLGISLEAASRGGEALSAFREAQRRGPLDPALADYVGERVEALSSADDPGAPPR